MPICVLCKRFSQDVASPVCEAFPKGIPEEIWHSEVDHRWSVPGDNGLQFDPQDKEAVLYSIEVFAPDESIEDDVARWREEARASESKPFVINDWLDEDDRSISVTEEGGWTMDKIIEVHNDAGGKFFDPLGMTYWKTTLFRKVHVGPGGVFFVTGAMLSAWREYTVRAIDPENGQVSTHLQEGGGGTFRMAEEAHAYAARLAASGRG